jgi:hypothetical protein
MVLLKEYLHPHSSNISHATMALMVDQAKSMSLGKRGQMRGPAKPIV